MHRIKRFVCRTINDQSKILSRTTYNTTSKQDHVLVLSVCLSVSLSLSALNTPTQLTTTVEGGRVFDGSAHIKSRALVSLSASISCCTLSLSARHQP
jgi:hypothetical protein